jgi:preprotein translocase subunit YajC
MFAMLMLFAQAAQDEAKKAAPEGLGALLSNPIVPILVVMVLFFFLIILPAQRRQRKEQENLMSSLKKNDEVVTAGGIIGVIANLKEGEDEVTLKIDDNARIRVLRSSIVRLHKKKADEPAAAPATPPAAVNTNIKPTT